MPRKYRPPASSKRRKAKTVDYDFPTPPEEADTGAAAAAEDTGVADMEDAVVQSRSQPRLAAHDRPERHVRRDYIYVRNEAIRIGVIGGVLIAGIVVIGFFR